MDNVIYPFAALVGQEDLKKAILLNIINPRIGGVLISGEKGTAKSTIVRAIPSICSSMKVIDLPLNITEDRLVGSIDLEKAILKGKKVFYGGLLKEAHKNILYIDEVNLLSDSIVNIILQVSSSGINRIEREGISFAHPSEFILIGTMNPEEGRLKSQFLDKFGLFVAVEGEEHIERRKEIVKRRIEYEVDKKYFYEKWRKECEKVTEKIMVAKSILSDVVVSEEILNIIFDTINAANCEGNRTEIIMTETVRALVALEGRKRANFSDVKEAIKFVLPHRGNIHDGETNEKPKENREENTDDNHNYEEEKEDMNDIAESLKDLKDIDFSNSSSEDEIVEKIGEIFKVKDIRFKSGDRIYRKGSGKRSATRTNSKQGRYVRYRIKEDKIKDIALDGTLRAAAPYQKFRDKEGLAIAIKKEDLREKVREKRTGTTIIFVVDASGSIVANKRMEAAKGAIASLLTDAYEKRDKVALVAFRKESAEVLLPVTRSVALAERSLKDIPSGGKTPLASGLLVACDLIKTERRRDEEMIPLLVLISDGRANVSITGDDPLKEAFRVGEKIREEKIKSLIVDTESGFIKFGTLKQLAQIMNGDYFNIEDLNDEVLYETIKALV